tara:strand:- start:94 stop:375 length:282 start_codon:yes stop_codon:yes gene_type:complete
MINVLRIEFDVRLADGEYKGLGFPDDPNATETFVMTDTIDDESFLGHHADLDGMRHSNGQEIPVKYQALVVPVDEVLNLFTLLSKGDDQYHQR